MVLGEISVSLDGFVAGPNLSEQEPLGVGGEQLHDWVIATEAWRRRHGKEGGERNADSEIVDSTPQAGAVVMGRKMFGGAGDWDPEWRGWWGDEPPFHSPVFVLTHHEREDLEMQGGTTFHFVTGGIEAAIDRATEAAGDKPVLVAGGGSTIGQAIESGRLDELFLHIVPVLLGDGSRLFDGLAGIGIEQTEVIPTDTVTHVKYRFTR